MKKTVITLMLALMSATASTYAGAAAGKDGVKNIVPENIIVKQTTRFADGRTLVVDIVPYIALAYRDITKPIYYDDEGNETLEEFDKTGKHNTRSEKGEVKVIDKAGRTRVFPKK